LNKNVRTINYLAKCVWQAFIFLVAKLLRNVNRYDLSNGAQACPSASVAWLKNVNRRTVDVTASRQFFSIHIAMNLPAISLKFRATSLQCTGLPQCLLHDEFCQETLLNLLLCNYLHYNLYDQAEKFGSTIWSVFKPVQSLFLLPLKNSDNSSGVYRCKRVYSAGCL